jgi:ribosomal protein S18 acetylase RimI-like enzyme
MSNPLIIPFDNSVYREQVISLWESIFSYDAPHNRPILAIDKKLAHNDGLFFVAVEEMKVVGTIMAGYDGHRGWIYSVAVAESHRRRGFGSQLVHHAEKMLTQLGCLKINLQIAEGNESVAAFYETLGYRIERRVSMGKKIAENTSSQQP